MDLSPVLKIIITIIQQSYVLYFFTKLSFFPVINYHYYIRRFGKGQKNILFERYIIA